MVGLVPAHAGPGRARHRRRAGARRHPLPRGRAGLRAAERRQARAGRAARRHGLAPGRPGPPGHQARGGPRGPPGLDRQPVRRPEPLRGRRGRQHRRRQLLRLEPLDDVGVQRPAGAALRLLHHRGQGARHPPEGDRRSAPRRSRRSRTSSPPRRRRSTPSSRRPRTCSSELKAEEREALLSRGSVRDALRRRRLRPRGRRDPLRHGPGRQVLRLRRGRPQLLRLLRPDDDGLGAGGRLAAALVRAPSTASARTSPRATSSPATWSSTTRRSATSRCTSATA